jgi:hypothetical protein
MCRFMREEMLFCCSCCAFSFTSWKGGKNYLVGRRGKRFYVFPPVGFADVVERAWGEYVPPEKLGEFLSGKTGCETEHLCVACFRPSFFNAEIDPVRCRRCGCSDLLVVSSLEGRSCPKCREGIMTVQAAKQD